jgi:hypothetical protein
MLIKEFHVSENVVNYFNEFFIKNIINFDSVSDTCTKNGYQTINVIKNTNQNYLDEIVYYCETYLNEYYGENLSFFEFYIDHLHIIKYNPGGYQIGHTHSCIEDHSFILYLNDSDGITRFYVDKNFIDIVPQKNKIVFFDSSVYHEGLVCSSEKIVLVGSIRFRHKVWKNR